MYTVDVYIGQSSTSLVESYYLFHEKNFVGVVRYVQTFDFQCTCFIYTVCFLQGCLAAIPLAFVFPPMCVLRLQQEPILSVKSIPKLVIAIFGIISAILGLAMTILNVAEGKTCHHGYEPDYCVSDSNSTWLNGTLGNATTTSLYSNTTNPS